MGDETGDEGVRWPRIAIVGIVLGGLTLLVGLGTAFVAAFVVDRSGEPTQIVEDAMAPVAPVALADGGFLFAERTTGRILRSTPSGEVSLTVQVEDELRTDGQRGVLGLAVQRTGEVTEIYASWTRASDGRLVVGRLDAGSQVLVWEGPESADLANGGTLVFRGSELLIGVGELADPGAVADPSSPNGKILVLDPSQGPEQVPRVLAGGWHNPFALTVARESVWLVDNAPGSEAERLVRIVEGDEPVVLELEGTRAPSSLDVLPDGDLVLCGFVSEVVERIPVPEEGVEPPGEVLGPPCATGVTVLADGSVVTTTVDAVWRDPEPT